MRLFTESMRLVMAIKLAVDAHHDQLDKAGMPYILHPLHVMGQVEGIDAKIVAVMHDVVEDTGIELFDVRYNLSRNGIDNVDNLIDAIDAITHRKGESNIDYWNRVKANSLALQVKLADIAHNSSEARLAALPKEDRDRLRNKYQRALEFLND